MKFCAWKLSCADDPYAGFPALEAWADDALRSLTERLPELYGQLRRDAPNARIVVLGYPKLFSEDPSIRNLCAVYETLFDDGERHKLNRSEMRLNRVIETAALSAGLEYIELSYIFAGHETCASDGPWLQFVNRDWAFQDGNFHPEEDGQLMMARTVACYLTIVRQRPTAGEDVSAVTVPAESLSAEEVQQPVTTGPSGDLGDQLYDCATGQEVAAADLDRINPPLAEVQQYPATEPASLSMPPQHS